MDSIRLMLTINDMADRCVKGLVSLDRCLRIFKLHRQEFLAVYNEKKNIIDLVEYTNMSTIYSLYSNKLKSTLITMIETTNAAAEELKQVDLRSGVEGARKIIEINKRLIAAKKKNLNELKQLKPQMDKYFNQRFDILQNKQMLEDSKKLLDKYSNVIKSQTESIIRAESNIAQQEQIFEMFS